MPRGDPFSAMCQLSARLSRGVVADLHMHTTASDGDNTPSQILVFANRARLQAISITDHDTMAGYHEAKLINDNNLKLIAGIECSVRWQDREVHLLGYQIHTVSFEFASWLEAIRESREKRFHAYIAALHAGGTRFADGRVEGVVAGSKCLGRRHVARLLIQSGLANHYFDAFRRYLHPLTVEMPAKELAPLADVVHWIHDGGGYCSLAHPRVEMQQQDFAELRDTGLDAVEVVYPGTAVKRGLELRGYCKELGLGITGGSDYHGGANTQRAIGSYGLNEVEYGNFLASRVASAPGV